MKILIVFLFLGSSAWGFELSAGLHQMMEKVQNSNGAEDNDPFSPAISIGTHFDTGWGFWFSPQLGYIMHQKNSDDGFSGYKMESFFLNYDAVFFPTDWNSWSFRAGISNFVRTTKDNGAAVTIPNGQSTATAYRPKSTTSNSFAISLAAELNLDSLINMGSNLESVISDSSETRLKSYGVRLTLNIFSPLKERKRNLGMQIAGHFYF